MTDPDGRDPFDELLRRRLDRLAAAIPVDPYPNATGTARRSAHRRRTLRLAVLTSLMLVLFALGTVAGSIIMGPPQSSTGAFAEGEVLHCSGLDQMTPIAAAAWLQEHGLVAHWQIEDRSAKTSVQQETPPDRGTITDALALADGHVLILVDLDRTEPLRPQPCT